MSLSNFCNIPNLLSTSGQIPNFTPLNNFLSSQTVFDCNPPVYDFSMLSERKVLKNNSNEKNTSSSSLLTNKKKKISKSNSDNNTIKTYKSTENKSQKKLSKEKPLKKKPLKKMSVNLDDEKIVSINFEVFGKVQRVFFRKYTKLEGKKLGLRGWCMNTPEGTVKGLATGRESQIEKFKDFLEHKGSPKSKIDHAVFSLNDKEATEKEFVVYR